MSRIIYLKKLGQPPVLTVYPTVEEALEAFERRHEGPVDDDADVQLGVYRDRETGEAFFGVTEDEGHDAGMHCALGEVTEYKTWWKDDWTDEFDSSGVVIPRASS
jgi:hypothetical protein